MISKELSEILDALTRETGESMLPYQELEILGFSPLGKSSRLTNSEAEDDNIDYDDENGDDDYNDDNIDEEYEFDEDDEEYTLLAEVLRLNNCRKKYFA